MKRRISLKLLIPVVLAALLLLAGGLFYLDHVQKSLWELSVSSVLEVTTQGAKSFEVFIDQNDTMLEGRANVFAQYDSADPATIGAKLDLYEGGSTSFSLLDLTHGVLYINSEEKTTLTDEQMKKYAELPRNGILEPINSEYTGVRVLVWFERFTFADGASGMVRRAIPVSEVSSRFSLSFYDGEGYSYIVNEGGDIILRSGSETGSLAIDNIFDVIAHDDNSEQDAAEFKGEMSGENRGVMRLNFNGTKHVFAFVPISGTDGWYLVSMVPDNVIMEHADKVMMSSEVIIWAAGVVILIFAAFVILSVAHNKQIRVGEAEIRYREQLFNMLTRSTDDVVIMLGGDRKTVIYVSPNFERVTGITREEVISDVSCIRDAVHGAAASEGDFAPDGIAMDDSTTFEGNFLHRETGETRWFGETVYHTVIEGMERFIVILADKTTDKSKQQTLTEALEIAKVANESKSSFLANMSHDIRTPMNTIVGLAALLHRDAEDPERVREHTEKLDSSSRHLLGLINNILDMSKIENGKTSLSIGEFSLAALVGELDSIIRLQTGAKKQDFDITVQGIINEDLIGDRQRISQVLMNILSNAVKYTPEGGHILFSVRQLGQVTKDIARIRFIVSDNGIGMSKEYQEKLFLPFTREVSTTVNQVQGTGLGMAITKNLIELMGGTIDVESEQGKGSTFIIDLDLQIAHGSEDDSKFWEEHGISSVLVVDDEVDICTDILSAMSGTGVSMQFALDGETAVRMTKGANVSGKDFDLILLDWQMPVMNGLETAKKIRAAVPAHIPIMILTAYDYEEIRGEGVAAGIDGFLAKPFFLSNFKEIIRSVRKNEEFVSSAPADQSIAGMHFLCAEDNALNAEILCELLDIEGATSETAVNGREAVERFAASKEGTFDAVLMDVQMPVMNGYEATRAIRRLDHPQAATIPIVAMTANAFADDVRAALDSGMNAHLAKPVDMKKVVAVLSKLCSKQ